jgi:hypothetical protein
MTDLTRDDVRALARAVGLALDGGDLAEVTHRLNAFLDALAPLGRLPLQDADPVPFAVDP